MDPINQTETANPVPVAVPNIAELQQELKAVQEEVKALENQGQVPSVKVDKPKQKCPFDVPVSPNKRS